MPEFDFIPKLIRHGIRNYAANNLLLYENDVITYSALEAISAKYAGFFNKYIKVPNGLVALVGSNPIDVYSILLAGHAYLPLDERWPIAHITAIIEDAQPVALLCRDKSITGALHQNFKCEVVSVSDVMDLVLFDEFNAINTNTAYILYTSGSTGKPKGVVHTHKSAMAFLNWCAREFTMNEPAKCISIAPFQFDLSVFDLFYPFFSGGSLLIVPHGVPNTRWIAEALERNKVNVVYSTPSFFKLLFHTGRVEKFNYSHIKYILSAGERLTYSMANNINQVFISAQLYNLYGPTETNVCTYYKVNDIKEEGDVPIGKCCPYAKAFVNNNGELLITGDSLMSVYLNSPTAFIQKDNLQYYPTGDVVELDADGNFVFKGRTDNMLKRNGYRIEPAQVEACLAKLQGVEDVRVIGYYKDGNARLVAFIKGVDTHSALQCKLHCLNYLPDYMVPDKFVMLTEWPLNFNNKIDLQALLQQYD